MFTDKSHSKQGILACVLGVSGLFALIYAICRVYLQGGTVKSAQTLSLLLALLYAVTGLVLSIYAIVKGDTFRLFPGMGVVINGLLLICLTGLFFWGMT